MYKLMMLVAIWRLTWLHTLLEEWTRTTLNWRKTLLFDTHFICEQPCHDNTRQENIMQIRLHTRKSYFGFCGFISIALDGKQTNHGTKSIYIGDLPEENWVEQCSSNTEQLITKQWYFKHFNWNSNMMLVEVIRFGYIFNWTL